MTTNKQLTSNGKLRKFFSGLERHHKATGQAFVELHGHRMYLGRFDRPETRQRYHRLIAEWEANGRRIPVDPKEATVAELLAAFWKHAETYYGRSSNEIANFRLALRPVAKLYGETRVSEFGPRALKAVRQIFIDRGNARTYVNKSTQRVRRVFRWGVENELVPPDVLRGLEAVAGIRYGRMEIRETDPVKPVPAETVDATLRHMTPTLRRMVQVQRFTGMRPAEVCIMRGCDLDVTGRAWTYKPTQHKTRYRGGERTVFIGPRAQAVLSECLKPDTTGYLFSPVESERERLQAQHAARKTPLSCGNRPGTNVKRRPRKQPRDHYDTQSYGRSIDYACDRAFPPTDGLDAEGVKIWRREHRWSPNQLRHSFATDVRREHGLEAAQVLCGHARADVTQVYAERDAGRAVTVVLKIG